MTGQDIVAALNGLRPGSAWVLRGNALADLQWLSPGAAPTEADVAAWLAAVKHEQVDAERDRRLLSFPFAGKRFDFCDGRSDINIAGAGTLALAAIMSGAQAGNLRWADPDNDFAWVAADNTSVPMDAVTCLNFAKAAADWKARHIRIARAIKDTAPIPADYASNARWPS